jgi:putative sterol carrier protein
MAVKTALDNLYDKISANPQGITGLQAVYQFNVTGEPAAVYQIKFSNNKVVLTAQEEFTPDCTLSISEKNLLKLIEGTLNPTTAYMFGKLKIKGDLSLAMKLQGVLQRYSS